MKVGEKEIDNIGGVYGSSKREKLDWKESIPVLGEAISDLNFSSEKLRKRIKMLEDALGKREEYADSPWGPGMYLKATHWDNLPKKKEKK